MKPWRDHNSILQDAAKQGLYEHLVQQLQKDFDRANVRLKFSLKPSPDTLFAALHEKMYQLIMERFADYLNVLYVVDVPEREFKNVRTSHVVEVSKEVSLLILQREWQKVLMKHKPGT
jgi:hypothetical protein